MLSSQTEVFLVADPFYSALVTVVSNRLVHMAVCKRHIFRKHSLFFGV